MPSKKELLKRIEDLEERITRLENMHANVMLGRSWERPFAVQRGALWETDDGRVGFYGLRQLTAREVQFQPHHPHPKQVDYRCLTNVPPSAVDTDRIPKVTLEELARLVVDGTPIERTEKFEGQMGVKYDRTRKVESINTPLGSITAITTKKE